MAPLQPPQFNFPPIRYSPIQEAFRGALDVGLSELFQLPFQKLAQKRELQKYSQEQDIQRESEIRYAGPMALARQRSEINTGAVIPGSSLDADTRSNLARTNAAPKYSVNGEDYYEPSSLAAAKRYNLPVPTNVQAYLDDARRRMGMPAGPVKEGELKEVSEAAGVALPIREWQTKMGEFEELRVDDLIRQANTPGPEFLEFANKIAFEQDPEHPGHLTRDYHDIFVYSKIPQYMNLLQNPVLQRPENAVFRKQLQTDLNTALQLAPRMRFPSTFFPTKDDFDRTLSTVRSASASASMSSEAAIMARLAAKWNLLRDPDSDEPIKIHGNQLDMSRAIMALQHNPPLLEAMVYATKYGTWDNMQWGSRIGSPYPTNKIVRDLLQYQIFPAMGGGKAFMETSGVHNPNSMDYNPSVGMGGGEGPAANQQQPATPTGGGKSLLVPAGPGQVLGTGPSSGTAPVNQVGMSEGGQALYNGIFTKTKANPAAFPAMRATMDSLFSGPPEHTLDMLKKLARDPTLPLTPDDQNRLLLAVHNIEAAPQAKRASLIAILKYQVIGHAVQAREDALGQTLNVKPDATATGEKKPAEGGEKPKKEE